MIEMTGDLSSLLRKAQETGSVKALADKLEYLQHWGDDAEYSVQVKLHAARGEADISFLRPDGSRVMVGGLVYHKYNNSWGVHT